jgi:hypothetical protein
MPDLRKVRITGYESEKSLVQVSQMGPVQSNVLAGRVKVGSLFRM